MTLHLDKILRLLANEQRRRIVSEVLERSTEADGGVAFPPSAPASESDDEYAELELYHVHLPKLADADVVDWDRENREVTPGSKFEAVRPVLEAVLRVSEEHYEGE